MTDRFRLTLQWSLALSALLGVVIIAAVGVGPVPIAPTTTVAVLGSLIGVVDPAPLAPSAVLIIAEIRLPRVLLAGLVGIALATAGAVMQGFFRNPLADPSIIGVSSGAAVGAVAVIVLGVSLPAGLGLQTAAFSSAVATGFVVYLIARRGGRTPVATLLLAGVAVQAFLGALISFMTLLSGWDMRRVLYWLMGHLGGTTWDDLSVIAVVVPVLLIATYLHAHALNVLTLGESSAQAVGIAVERTKQRLLILASVLTAVAVAVTGVIGFVGLIVPHGMRLVVGADHRILLPTSALAGASFLIIADAIARSAAAELPVGIVTAAVGAPFFLYLLRREGAVEL